MAEEEAAAHAHEAARGGMHKFAELMLRRIGPLPIWAWSTAAVGTFGAVWYLHQKSAGAGATTSDVSSVGSPTGSGSSDTTGSSDFSSVLSQLEQQQQQFQSGILEQFQQQQQADQQAQSALASGMQQAFSSQSSAIQQALAANQASEGQFIAQIGQQVSGFESSVQNSLNAGLAQVLAAAAAQQAAIANMPMVRVPSAGGGTVSVPASVAAAGSKGGTQYVAGTKPATSANPAGGGVWQGLNDQQTQSLFEKTYGSNWQQVWQQQHDAQVAANGG